MFIIGCFLNIILKKEIHFVVIIKNKIVYLTFFCYIFLIFIVMLFDKIHSKMFFFFCLNSIITIVTSPYILLVIGIRVKCCQTFHDVTNDSLRSRILEKGKSYPTYHCCNHVYKNPYLFLLFLLKIHHHYQYKIILFIVYFLPNDNK